MRILLMIAVVWGGSLTATNASENLAIQPNKPSVGPYVEVDKGYMIPYEIAFPGSNSVIKMIPVAGGKVELTRATDPEKEIASIVITIEPFWIAETETTWGQYQPFMELVNLVPQSRDEENLPVVESNLIHAVTAPSDLWCGRYYAFEYGTDARLPAVMMTHYGAQQYTKWLSKLSGQQLRLPSELEWEYAASAGTRAIYGYGDDPAQLSEFAWYYDNADERPHFVRQKKPNDFGLYDMQGNVWEWVLDAYHEGDEPRQRRSSTVIENVRWPTKRQPMMLKGGSWDDDESGCRISAKLGSDEEEWKTYDPNLPQSVHWLSAHRGRTVGFRIVRPLRSVPWNEAERFYTPQASELKRDVIDMLKSGRGAVHWPGQGDWN